MSHAFSLALLYALVLQAACLLHAAAAGLVATRRVVLDPLTLIVAAIATAVGMALVANTVTAALGLAPDRLIAAGAHAWLVTLGWLGALVLLFLALLLHETSRLGRTWRAMAANAAGLVAVGVPVGLVLPTLLGLLLAGLAGNLAPVPATTDWLPLACLALLVLGRVGRPKGRATLTVLLAWLTGALVATGELLLGPPVHVFVIAAAALLAAKLVAPRLVRSGID